MTLYILNEDNETLYFCDTCAPEGTEAFEEAQDEPRKCHDCGCYIEHALTGRAADALRDKIIFLNGEEYNRRVANHLVELYELDIEQCSHCGSWVTETSECERCHESCCENCIDTCSDCGDSVCSACLYHCEHRHCHATFCRSCAYTCSSCDSIFCSEHINGCDTCDEHYCESCYCDPERHDCTNHHEDEDEECNCAECRNARRRARQSRPPTPPPRRALAAGVAYDFYRDNQEKE